MEKFKSISELAEMTGKDRGTIRKLLEGLKPAYEESKLKVYFTPVALSLIVSRSLNKGIDPDLVVEWYNNGTISHNPYTPKSK